MQKYRIMHNKATTSSNFLLYPVISFLLMFGLLIAGCSDNENEEELPAPDVPDYSTIIVKDIQNMPKNFTFDRVEVKVTGLDRQGNVCGKSNIGELSVCRPPLHIDRQW